MGLPGLSFVTTATRNNDVLWSRQLDRWDRRAPNAGDRDAVGSCSPFLPGMPNVNGSVPVAALGPGLSAVQPRLSRALGAVFLPSPLGLGFGYGLSNGSETGKKKRACRRRKEKRSWPATQLRPDQ